MKHLILILSLFVLTACGSDDSTTPAEVAVDSNEIAAPLPEKTYCKDDGECIYWCDATFIPKIYSGVTVPDQCWVEPSDACFSDMRRQTGISKTYIKEDLQPYFDCINTKYDVVKFHLEN